MTAGRPTKYSPAYCNEVIEVCATGLSLTAFAGDIGVARSTVNKWMEEHEEFSEAVKIAKAKRTAALERQMFAAENGPTVTARIFALKNADPDEWREKVSNELTGKDGGPIKTEDVSARDIIARRIAGIAGRRAESEDPGGPDGGSGQGS